MGCCQSSEKKRTDKVKRFETSLAAIVKSVANVEPDLTGLFAACTVGYGVALECEAAESYAAIKTSLSGVSADVNTKWSNFEQRFPAGAAEAPYTDARRARLVAAWLKFDKDGSGDLSVAEIEKLVVAMNFPDFLSKKLLEAVKKQQAGGKVGFDFAAFETAYNSLCDWEELDFAWQAISEGGGDDKEISAAQLRAYMESVQGESNVSDKRVATIMSAVGGRMNKRGFFRFLTDGKLNGALDSAKTDYVYQDMSHPFCHYFMSSSHNTYLSGDQLTSDSKPECYKKALLDGCRCVELDCWDGKDGQPIIYHGYTRTSKISFQSVIEAINETAFTTSDYPVTLSLEIHTSVEQQKEMARIMRAVFGATLAEPSWFPGEQPQVNLSVEFLRRKIVVKGKRLPPDQEIPPSSDDDDEEGDKPEAKKQQEAEKKKAKGEKKKTKMAPELSCLVIMESKHMKNFDEAFAKAKPYECVSIAEGKATAFATKNAAEMSKHNKLRFARIYPSGARINSSNYHPQIHWNVGAQIVALNWQTSDSYELRLNKGRFQDNGGCGFILKPDYLRDLNVTAPTRPPIRLTVEILSAYGLPKPADEGSASEVVDPYIKVFVEGPDLNTESHALTTDTINDNGFHPVFVGTAKPTKFTVTVPVAENSTLVVQAFDKDVDFDDFLAECFVPLTCLQTGVRALPLWNIESLDLPGAVIMARITVE